MHTTSLVVDSIKEKDSGSYKVMAINTEGSAESTASLLVSLREEQSANYLGFVKRSAKAHESVDTMAEQRKERKFRVDLRCVGSPFDKMSKVHKGRSRSKTALVRTVYFRSSTPSKEIESEKESKRLETASERAPSPPPMFDRSERFNDRFSDIYCDRRTGARFSDKFSDRCSDRYSERFSDTESLHNEVRTKLTTLQKAVKQKKRLSISTMSSSEFDLESVTSEPSYSDYVEKLRVKPSSLPDVQQLNRPFDLGESHREFQSKSTSMETSRPRVRHSFEPQSRTRAIQIMRGELVDTLIPEAERKSGVQYTGTLDKPVDRFVESQADVKDKQFISDHHSAAALHKVEATKLEVQLPRHGVSYSKLDVQLTHPEVSYSETAFPEAAMFAESREAGRSVATQEEELLMKTQRLEPGKDEFPSKVLGSEEEATAESIQLYEESLRAQYNQSLEAERIQCEEKLLALRIRKWQQGSRMSEEEAFHPETDLPAPAEMHYMEPSGQTYAHQEAIEKRETLETEAMPSSAYKSPRMKARAVGSELAHLSTPRSPKVKVRGEEVETFGALLTKPATSDPRLPETEIKSPLMLANKSPKTGSRATELEVESQTRAKIRTDDRYEGIPRPRQGKPFKESLLGEAVTPAHIATDTAETYEEECERESLRAQYEKSLEAERMQCEEKLLALRIRKWQKGIQMSEDEAAYPESDLPIQPGTQYMETEEHIYTQPEMLEKIATTDSVTMSTPKAPLYIGRVERDFTSAPLPEARMKGKQGELGAEVSVLSKQKSPKLKARVAEAETLPRTNVRTEQKMLFEKTREERELQLSRENISELKNENEKFVSEEEALTQRIMKWQQDVQMEQEQVVKSDWVGGYSNVAEASAPDSVQQPERIRGRKTSPGKTEQEKFLAKESLPARFQEQRDDSLQWPPTGDLTTEGRETRLQRDSEYFVSEEEALAQRILKWQKDVVEQEEVAELETEWALESHFKQPGPGMSLESQSPPIHSDSHADFPHQAPTGDSPSPYTTLMGRSLPTKQISPHQRDADYKPSPDTSFPGRKQHDVGMPLESPCGLGSSVKDRAHPEASPVQGYLPAQLSGVPSEGYEITSPPGESPNRPSREFSPVQTHSPHQIPWEDMGREAEQRRGREEYDVNKSSRQRFQSDVREERKRKEEMDTTRESSERRQQRNIVGVRGDRGTGDLMRTKQGVDTSAAGVELGAKKRDERPVREESTLIELQGSRSERDSVTKGSRPVFLKEISSVQVKIGEMTEFTCQFEGDPLPTVTWLKDGHQLVHNPDYDIMSKANKSQLTVFYPTTDHKGTYDCVITNKHGKSICSGTLEITDKFGRKSGVTQEVVVTEEQVKDEENQESAFVQELETYTDSGKATLQVPQAVIHRRSTEETFSSSPVEIRVTAPTPVPGTLEEINEDKPQAVTEKSLDVQGDEGASQTIKHKFTFSFDVASEAPLEGTEFQNPTYPEGETAVLNCLIEGEPASQVTWHFDDAILDSTAGKYRFEVDGKVCKLYINNFKHTDVGVYKCVSRNKLGDVISVSDVSLQVGERIQFSKGGSAVEDILIPQMVTKSPAGLAEDVKKPVLLHKADVTQTEYNIIQTKDKPLGGPPEAPSEVVVTAPRFRPGISREAPTISGCGLSSSAAVINVSQIKQAFESESPGTTMIPSLQEEQGKETLFPEEFIPAVAISLDQQKQEVEHEIMYPEAPFQQPSILQEGSAIRLKSSSVEERVLLAEMMPKQFVEGVQESPELVRPKPQKPGPVPEKTGAGEIEMMKEETVHKFDRTSSFIPFQPEKVGTGKRSVKVSALTEEAVKPRGISESLKSERQSAVARGSLARSEAEVFSKEGPSYDEGPYVVEDVTEMTHHMKQGVEGVSGAFVLRPEIEHVREGAEFTSDNLVSIPEPSMDSGVFFSLPDSQADATEAVEEYDIQAKGQLARTAALGEKEPKPFIVRPKVDSSTKPLGLPEDAATEGSEEGVARLQEKADLVKTSTGEVGGVVAAAGSMEEEVVTFGAVYDYYNPPTDWGRPLSPESEMSIEIGSTVSEDIAEVTERFYTPGSSTEVSQPTVESFHTPKSPLSFHTPSSHTLGGFMTPQEYPFSPIEHKRPSTGDSGEKFFSPVQFLTSPADEGIETTPPGMNLDENRFLTMGRGSLGLATLQEKVQGIPPAFLKPLIKKRVFENESLTFYAEVFGLPSPEVKWFCNKTQLVADDRIIMSRDGDSISLTIHNVTKADQGEYICEAVNYVGEARSVALVVVVSQEVRFMPAPPAVTHQHVMEFDVEEDDSSRSPSPQEILLEVELDENEVKEFEKQVKIITIPEYTADNKSMIISLDVLPSIYEEGAVDFVTQEHEDLKIAFEVTEMPPRFINPICDMETPEGTTVMFECSLMGIPSPIVSWFKGDKKIPHNNKKYLHSSDGDNHFLKICRVTPHDSGVYTCRAINIVGETLCRASLVVLSAKAFSGKTRGRELTAVSLGSAKVQPQKFDMMVDNRSFDGDQVSEIELEFEFEQEADESQRAVRLVANTDNEMSKQGEKYVSINFDVFAEPAKDDKIEFKGKSSETCSFQFQVTETPPRCVIPLTNVTAAVGTPVILQCLVSGKPNPTAEWYKDGEHVTDSRCIIQEKTAGHFNLLITNAIQSDAGEYKCVIQNTAGCIETTALLKVF